MDILISARRSENNDRQSLATSFATGPLEHLESIALRHFDVQEQKVRKWEPCSIRELVGSAQIRDRLVAIGYENKGGGHIGHGESPLQQHAVIPIIFSYQDI